MADTEPEAQRPYMPDYGVGPELDGVLPWSWATERLERSRNYWVVTASTAGRPHAMPVWGLWVSERDQFFFSCASTSRKAANLRANPQVVITADDTVEVVSVEGLADEIDTADHLDLVKRWAAKYGADETDGSAEAEAASAQQLEEFLASTTGFLVRPGRAFGLIERADEFAQKATRWVWPEEA
jgi:hypothetical protein